MGSEGVGGASGGVGGGLGVTVMEVEAHESDRISIVVPSSIDRCSSFISQKEEMGTTNMRESSLWNKMPDPELCRLTNHLSSFDYEDAPGELKFASRNNFDLSMPSLEGKQKQRKNGKVARSSSGSSKRSGMVPMEEVTINEAEADDLKEKNQTAKQKTLNGKRGDKRNGKVPMKGKYDHFSLKNGMLSFNSTSGGNNFLGTCGLKPDTCDVTKHLDELSLNELLDGSYKAPSFAKDKGKKAVDSKENILDSFSKACSILWLHKPPQKQDSMEIDNNCNWMANCDTSVSSANAGDKGNTFTADMHDKVQDSFCKPKIPAIVLDFLLCQPKDILKRLALPPHKDLESLLMDAAKPAVFLKNSSDSRGKQISQQASLSPFPWSHNSGGYCKSNTDATKLSSSRTTCQGRWVKIGNPANSLEGKSSFLVELESLTYDRSLVPLGAPKCCPENEINPSTSVSFPRFELGSSSSVARSIASELPPESGSKKCEGHADHSPRLLAAAQTLFDIATHSMKQELHGMVRWPKKPSEKTMKACKSKSNSKSGEILAASKSITATNDGLKIADEILPLKNPRLVINEKSKDLGHNTVRTGPVNWSMPRSNRPSPGKSFRDSFAELKRYNARAVKQSCMMPPPPPPQRLLDKACNSRQKLRKLEPVEWNREGDKLD
ncbi:hypothetical protein U1Q18_021198 [Sarracenia purpurea var. burkii]